MSRTRVVVTGIGLASPIGNSLRAASGSLREGRHGIVKMPEFAEIEHMKTQLGAPIRDLVLDYPRKKVRTMGRVSLLSLYATEQALAESGLRSEELLGGRAGVAYGSTAGASRVNEEWCRKMFITRGLSGIQSTDYIKFMSHTCAANLAIYYGITGRVISTCAACVSASQGIGAGYEAIRAGVQDVMICGGAEEMHFSHAAIFDIMFAASKRNDEPDLTPRPFDKARDGLVVGEGAGTFILESYEHARARGANILAEIRGYGTNCDGTHVTNPSSEGMAGAMSLALRDAGLDKSSIGYVNAHATATEVGDIAESLATAKVIGANTPISSTKSFTGHTLGACGAIEAAFCIAMMREGWVAPNRTLDELDERCAKLDYVGKEPRQLKTSITMSNNFAFGGINTSLILGKV
ncbi:MAG: beta-ketoacyl synthase, C-terminal domain protein [Myxococcaceae bacterium]|nr:beta-ketoacyl synthase, C-terminal domain protein [Myxococcaceae bacterium]